MYEIPKPQLLDPDRENRDDREDFTAKDHRTQAQVLAKALGESCAYADQLWEQVDALRAYLLDSLPPDPHIPGPRTGTSASPTGPDDDAGWTRWINAFATTTSVLCGSHGDSGFGLSRARQEAQLRRTAPVRPSHDQSNASEESDATLTAPSPASAQDLPSGADSPPLTWTVGRALATGAVAVLALRGLLTMPGLSRIPAGRT